LRPANMLEMSTVRGVGAAKLERYGRTFLRVLEGLAPEAALA
ncbi:MAG: HRDC domain-containing protein, partial [Chloroflexi bacterium]|nr:HRDC domain-containing protein [Chloroflexota bacterium]